ncbi:MAG: hypothetical protein R3335_01540 [Anaerolineales bacterium]|nr:hypothetical protein [Anaerolineales bacterium]
MTVTVTTSGVLARPIDQRAAAAADLEHTLANPNSEHFSQKTAREILEGLEQEMLPGRFKDSRARGKDLSLGQRAELVLEVTG